MRENQLSVRKTTPTRLTLKKYRLYHVRNVFKFKENLQFVHIFENINYN